jgi:hypothetical protein
MNKTAESEQTPRNVEVCWSHWVPVVIASLFIVAIFVLQTCRSATADHGDMWTDLQLALAGERLANAGPSTLRYMTVLDDGHLVGLPPLYYVNWPPTGALLAAYALSTGRSLINARTVMLLFAGLALIAFYWLILRLRLGPCAALAGTLALACAAPFHLLADSLGYFTTDTFGRIVALLCILTATLEPSRRTRGLAFAGMFLAIVFLLTISGYETIASIGLYTLVVPLIAACERPLLARLRIAAMLCLTYGGAVATGIWLRFENAAFVVGTDAAKSGLLDTARYRSSEAPVPAVKFAGELLHRLWVYYQWHLIFLAIAVAVCGWYYSRHREGRRDFMRALLTIIAIGLSDCVWMALVRQHSFLHVHTIHQIGPALCLLVALAVGVLFRALPASRSIRAASIAALSIVGLLAFLNIGVVARANNGNVIVRYDWTYRERILQTFASVIPPGSILVSEIGQQPTVEYLLRGHGFVVIDRPLEAVGKQDLPVYIITLRSQGSPEFTDCMRRFQLVMFNSEFALFRAVNNPGLNKALLQDASMQGIWIWNQPMWAYPLHPAWPGVPFKDAIEVPLQPSGNVRFRLWVMIPDYNLPNTDGVSIDVDQLGEGDRLLKERTIFLSPSLFRAARQWVSYPLEQPGPSDQKLRVKVGCGKSNNCAADLVYLFLSLDQT